LITTSTQLYHVQINSNLVAPVHVTFPEDQMLAVTEGFRIFIDTICSKQFHCESMTTMNTSYQLLSMNFCLLMTNQLQQYNGQ